MEKEIIFEAKHMHKEFGPTIALKDVDFTLRRGEIRGLIGENGSGKSTIMSIASGMQSATSGEMFYHGKPWHPQTMVESQKQGISMILQEANSIPNITVAHNIFAGREKEFMSHGIFNSGKMAKEAQQILDSFGISHIRAQDSINKYSFEDRKLVELVRCVDENTEILVVDETTTALSQQGRDILYDLIHRMASEGKAVVFISHDIDEIFDQCNALTVLRDGEIVGTVSEEEILACRNSDNRKEAVKPVRHMMVGREMGDKYYREDMERSSLPETILEVSHLTFGQIKDFSLSLKRGEIVGIGGLSGCGMHEVGRAIFGLEKLKSGSVTCNNKPIRTPLDAIRQNMGYISKNRDTEALIMQGAIGDNIALPSLDRLSHCTFISPAKERALIQEQIDSLSIKCNNSKQYVSTLSGGNKQKVSFAKWMANDSEVVIMDCPTRGVDVGVKQSMYQIMEEMKKNGKAIIMISEEMTELIGMSDRLIIMKDFQVTKEFDRSPDLKQTDIIEYMI
ncbi:MAG: sugar ABC transporter ATP-binding protein [Lachnospiraceae bacterium]|nr:sugar ABC transporter ATP-binding protein [Lachnospiraceae bacterium]